MFQREERAELVRKKNYLVKTRVFFYFLSVTKTFPGEIEMGAGLKSELHGT